MNADPAELESILAKFPAVPFVAKVVRVWVVPAVMIRPVVNPAVLTFNVLLVELPARVMLSPENVSVSKVREEVNVLAVAEVFVACTVELPPNVQVRLVVVVESKTLPVPFTVSVPLPRLKVRAVDPLILNRPVVKLKVFASTVPLVTVEVEVAEVTILFWNVQVPVPANVMGEDKEMLFVVSVFDPDPFKLKVPVQDMVMPAGIEKAPPAGATVKEELPAIVTAPLAGFVMVNVLQLADVSTVIV